ncbi:hypothetical protein DFJ77DRAFT_472819 [Powellomyces hirtus]|nr:hypothetical protein DFJ77DRAFT_472819 [Powellomyces hirtus]
MASPNKHGDQLHLHSRSTVYPPATSTTSPTAPFAVPTNTTHPGPPHRSALYTCVDPHLWHLRADPTLLVTSHIVSSRALMWIRVVACAWIVFLIPFNLARDAERYLFYFTQLTWLGLGAWFAVAAFQGWRFNRDGNMNRFLKQHKVTQWMTWNLYVMTATFHWIVPIVFWSLLSGNLVENGTAYTYWTNVNVHAMDLVLILMELYLNRIPMFYSQWPSVIVAGVAFLAYAFFQHAVYQGYDRVESPSGWWVYGFLDTSKAGAWKYYIILPLAFVLFFCATVAMHKLRNSRREAKAAARKASMDAGHPSHGSNIPLTAMSSSNESSGRSLPV